MGLDHRGDHLGLDRWWDIGQLLVLEYFEDAQENNVLDGTILVLFAGEGKLNQLYLAIGEEATLLEELVVFHFEVLVFLAQLQNWSNAWVVKQLQTPAKEMADQDLHLFSGFNSVYLAGLLFVSLLLFQLPVDLFKHRKEPTKVLAQEVRECNCMSGG